MKLCFSSQEHKAFFFDCLSRTRDDAYHRAFFYLMGLTSETRRHLDALYDFETDGIKPDGLTCPWQTHGTVKICRLAFNLWNGYVDERQPGLYTPEELFASGYAPFFIEALRLRHPRCLCRQPTAPQL